MSEPLFSGYEPPAPAPEPEPVKHTERSMLDLIHARYSQTHPGNGPRYIVAEHVRNQCGFGGTAASEYLGREPRLRSADALVVDLWPSTGNLIDGFEVKVSRSDWLTELKDPSKAEAFRPYCDYWWLAVPDAAIVRDDLPDGWGLLVVGRDGKLRQRVAAPRLTRQPMPWGMTAALLRAAVKTAQTPTRTTCPVCDRPTPDGHWCRACVDEERRENDGD